MQPTVLALIEITLLAAGALAARGFVRRVGRGERKVVLMASVAAWLVFFGMVPFMVFAVLVPARHSGRRAAGPAETLVLNLVPLALAASPVAGAVQALRLTSSRERRHSQEVRNIGVGCRGIGCEPRRHRRRL